MPWKTLRLFAGLAPELMEEIHQRCPPRTHRQGEDVAVQGTPADSLLVLCEGELSVVQDTRMVRILEAPSTVGLTALLDEDPDYHGPPLRTATLRANTAVTVRRLESAYLWDLVARSPAFRRNVILDQSRDVVRMYRREARWLGHMTDFFQSPNARLVSGPYEAEEVTMVFLVIRGNPRRIQGVLPPGLCPLPGCEGHWILTVNEFHKVFSRSPAGEGNAFDYRETAPFLPVVGPGGLAVYCPELYPDNYLAIALGRELYGFPKRFGQTVYGEDKKELACQRKVDLMVGADLKLRAQWGEPVPADPSHLLDRVLAMFCDQGALREPLARVAASLQGLLMETPIARVPVLVNRQVPQCAPCSTFDLARNELSLIPFQVSRLEQVEVLPGAVVRYPDQGFFLDGACTGALRMRLSFSFGEATTVRDYQDRRSLGEKVGQALKRADPRRFHVGRPKDG